jgi:site-specific recombinase XerD
MSLIDEFIKDQEARGIGKLRLRKYRSSINTIKKYYEKDFSELTTEDLKDIVRKIEESNYSEWSKHDLKVVLRKFVRWINQKFNKSIDTSFISIRVKNNNKLPEEILTQEEIERMINACDNIRDKAIISVLYESGCRIGEFLSLEIKNVQFDQYGAIIIIPNGKTGKAPIPSQQIVYIPPEQLQQAKTEFYKVKENFCRLI